MALDDILRYESARVAEDKSESDPEVSLVAMGNHYRTLLGTEDPIIAQSLADAGRGLQITSQKGRPHITNNGLILAMNQYAGSYEKAFNGVTIGELVNNYLNRGYTIPDKTKEGILAYRTLTYEQLATNVKDESRPEDERKKMLTAIRAIGTLKSQRLDKVSSDIKTDLTDKTLKELYPDEAETH